MHVVTSYSLVQPKPTRKGDSPSPKPPVGHVHLIADCSTTTVAGEYQSLSYNIVTVSGLENPLAAQIYMAKLNTDSPQLAGKQDVSITLPEVPGFR